jgi:hypothetical protein
LHKVTIAAGNPLQPSQPRPPPPPHKSDQPERD